MAEISGPITGGSKGRVFAGPATDLAAHGYQEKEFFLEGTATRYRPRPGTELGLDGRWEVEAVEASNFKTRFVVYRPVDPQSFNGTVLACWNNVSAGFDGYNMDSPEILESGFAYAAVTAQRAGVHGMGDHPMGLVAVGPRALRLAGDPERRLLLRHLHPGLTARRDPTGRGRRSTRSRVSTCGTSWRSVAPNRPAGWPPTSTPSNRSRGSLTRSCRSSTSAPVRPWRSATTCSTRLRRANAPACRACRAVCVTTSTPRS